MIQYFYGKIPHNVVNINPIKIYHSKLKFKLKSLQEKFNYSPLNKSLTFSPDSKRMSKKFSKFENRLQRKNNNHYFRRSKFFKVLSQTYTDLIWTLRKKKKCFAPNRYMKKGKVQLNSIQGIDSVKVETTDTKIESR